MYKENKNEWNPSKDEVYTDKHKSTLTDYQKTIAPPKVDIGSSFISGDTTREGSPISNHSSPPSLSRQSSINSDSFYTPPGSPPALKRVPSDDSDFFSTSVDGSNSDLRQIRREIRKQLESTGNTEKQKDLENMREKISENIKANKKRNACGKGGRS